MIDEFGDRPQSSRYLNDACPRGYGRLRAAAADALMAIDGVVTRYMVNTLAWPG